MFGIETLQDWLTLLSAIAALVLPGYRLGLKFVALGNRAVDLMEGSTTTVEFVAGDLDDSPSVRVVQ